MLEVFILIFFALLVLIAISTQRKKPKYDSKLGRARILVPDQQKEDIKITTAKTKALSEYGIRQKISSLPKADVINVIDGDTVVVRKNFACTKVRLDSIDCPEDGQHWGDIAKYGLIKLVGGKTVQIEEHGLDSYGRILATIYIWERQKNEWINVNERMVTLGHAWVMRRFYDHLPRDRQDKLNRLERWARSKKIGLWKTADPVPPWRWRKEIY